MDMDKETSKFISLILRHKPEVIGITLDEHGWAEIDALIAGVSKTHPLDMTILERIVAEDEKQRYSFNEDNTLMAHQGSAGKVFEENIRMKTNDMLAYGYLTVTYTYGDR